MHQFIKNVAIGDTILAPSGVPFTQIQLRFYWEMASSDEPKTPEQISSENEEIGRQLMEAIWKREAQLKIQRDASIEEKKPSIEDHSG